MKKNLLLMLMAFMATVTAMAERVSIEQAEAKARQFLAQRKGAQQGDLASAPLRLARRQPLGPRLARRQPNRQQDDAAFYVFNVGQDKGFVLVSGDDRVPAILGYADHGNVSDDALPAHVQAWFDGYADQLAYLMDTNEAQAPRRATSRAAVAPLLTTTWNQGTPYNNKCPIDPTTKKRSATGCAATAMAQVINFHKQPAATIATIPAYTTRTHGIEMPAIAPTTIDWNNMCDSYSGTTTAAQKNAVATLMLLCGQALEMNYTSEESGASAGMVAAGLKNYFGFDGTTTLIERNAVSSALWDAVIYSDVASGHPVFYSGQSVGGGHAFVIDGYDGDGLFHVNWGWGGYFDGYYLLSVLNPFNNEGIGASTTEDGYSFSQSAVVFTSIGETDEVSADLLTLYDFEVNGSTTFTRASTSDDFTGISVTPSFGNNTGQTQEFMVDLFLMNEEGKGTRLDYVGGTIPYRSVYAYPFSDLSFGAGLADGDYYIVVASESEHSTGPELCWGSDVYRIKATIVGNRLTLTPPTIDLHATIAATGKREVGTLLPLTAQITNNGTYFNDDIFLYVDGTPMGGRHFEAEAGATETFEIDFVPTTEGRKLIELAYKNSEGELVIFASTTITVGAEASDVRHLAFDITFPDADSDYTVHKSLLRADVNITNDGENDYDDKVTLVLYDADGSVIDRDEQALTLPVGSSQTLSFAIDGMEDEQDYIVKLHYVSNPVTGETTDNDLLYRVYVEIEEEPVVEEPVLSGVITLLNANAEGNLDETTAQLQATITNTGNASTGQMAATIDLYQKNEETGWENKTYDGYLMTIEAGASQSFTVTFDVEAGGQYAAIISYGWPNGEGGYNWEDDGNSTIFFSVAADARHLVFTVEFPDMDDDNIVHSNPLRANVTFTNDGVNDYDDIVLLALYNSDGTTRLGYDAQKLTLPVGESQTLSFAIDGLEHGQDYLAALWYFSNPATDESTCNNQVYAFTADLIATGIAAATDVPAASAAHYDLAGRRISAPGRTTTSSRGIRIVRMSDGTTRKVAVK